MSRFVRIDLPTEVSFPVNHFTLSRVNAYFFLFATQLFHFLWLYKYKFLYTSLPHSVFLGILFVFKYLFIIMKMCLNL